MVIRYRLKITGESPFSFYSLYRANAVSDEQTFRAAAGSLSGRSQSGEQRRLYTYRAITESGRAERWAARTIVKQIKIFLIIYVNIVDKCFTIWYNEYS